MSAADRLHAPLYAGAGHDGLLCPGWLTSCRARAPKFPAVIPVEAFQEAEAPFPDVRVGQEIGVVSCQHPDRIRVLSMWQIVRSMLPACEAASLSLR
ncbi:hypothetical protein CYD94_25110 (plasmid) [Ralstonia solanacearum]|uniref:Uncharacterized protein n=2 Tax=Ralstonia solanacearum species complex TaxID=3116862 RepID=A0A454TNW2_9RALS|nr:hypothetical protein BC427_23145 [Ralstonia solanacearum FJAT-91]ASL76428.1 hypothetical protein BC350_23155 [Ralstonia pseudosolanacearum]AUS45328.1 hypothetical protein CYD94_25110 [Ralstonia solanacearum]AVV67562.1 hypothetical protein RSOE_04645 [Ralstonia solanacearum OE1-1]AST88305.1 hypothetical protein CIG66_17620 [Ralstonia pseudosolanacearum]